MIYMPFFFIGVNSLGGRGGHLLLGSTSTGTKKYGVWINKGMFLVWETLRERGS